MTTEEFFTLSENYTNDVFNDIRNRPHIETGMLVVVYINEDQTQLFGYARVTGMEWDEFRFGHYASLIMVSDRKQYHGVRISKLRQYKLRPSQARAFIRVAVNNDKYWRDLA